MVKGSKHTEEAKERMSAGRKGIAAWNKGTKRWWVTPQFEKGHIPWNKGIDRPEMSGSKHPMWKTGKTISSQGYVLVSLGKGKQMLEHRYLMERHLNRKLNRKEHIHHLNGDKTDNRIENLELMHTSDHNRYHATKQWEKGHL